MARPTKSITTRTGHMSKNEIDARIEYEAKLRGESDRIRPPSFLSKEQKKLSKGIVDYLTLSGILGNIDVHVLTDTKFAAGRPVIINEHIASLDETEIAIYFGDLKRALIVGERKALSLQKSTEYGFINDEIAIKANMRLDIKKALGEAMVIGTVSNVAKASRSKAA